MSILQDKYKIGDKVTFVVYRNANYRSGGEVTVTLTLEQFKGI